MTTDTDRLDFLIKHEAHVGWCRDGEYCDVYKSDEESEYRCLNKNYKFYTDPRTAIDEAIKNNP